MSTANSEIQEKMVEGLRFLQTNKGFLGREFLTWLWFYCESHNHVIETQAHGTMKLFLNDRMVLTSSGGSVHEHALKGGTPAYAAEARQALKGGKMLNEANFIMQDAERQWMWTMRAEDLSLKGIRLPSVSEADAQAHMHARLQHLQTLTDVLDSLFKEYMSVRLSPNFDKQLIEMGNWVNIN